LIPLGLLEPGAVKVARRVLRGPRRSNAPGLPDETYGQHKQGARYGHTKVRGYHPLLATVAGSDDVLGLRLRGGNAHTGRGAAGFLAQMFNRVREGGATDELVLRADSGFYSSKVTAACRKAAGSDHRDGSPGTALRP
jgi:hypothetical protein